jgi:glycosyltransferase involved in cell wall biosynthesis
MVGRNADQKDWPAFHRVERLVREEQPEVAFVNAGEEEPCDGREAIRRMDLFVMTSKHEELPTTMLECFLLGTPICGFLPEGGTSDILDFSDGALRAVFLAERDCDKLADLVRCLLNDPGRRQALVEDGWRILTNHFSAEKLVSGQLMNVYRGLMK